MAKPQTSPKSVQKAPKIAQAEPQDTGLDQSFQTAPGETLVRKPRVYKGTQIVDHDLFKLEVAKMTKNVSYTDVPDLVKLEHVHMFHTVDSNGKKVSMSSAVGGHHHDITVVPGKDGVPTIQVSEPRKIVVRKRKGRIERLSVPVVLDPESGEVDDHTHSVTYLGSERITLRKTNPEFAKFESAIRTARETAVENVREE